MKNRTLKVLIVGAGFMGEAHAKAYLNIENVIIAGIVEKNDARALHFSETYKCRSFSSIQDALTEEIDFVDICLPTPLHNVFKGKRRVQSRLSGL